MNKKQKIILIMGMWFIGIMVFAAPSVRFERTILPEANNTYDLGSPTSTIRAFYGGTASSTMFSVSANGTATSTIYGNNLIATSTIINGFTIGVLNVSTTTATSTLSNGIQLSAGCFRGPLGTCVGGSSLIGSGANTRVTFWTGADTLSSDSDFTYNSTSNTLTIPNISSESIIISELVNGDFHVSGDGFFNGNDINLGTGFATSTLSGGFGIGIGTTTPGAAFAVATGTASVNTAMLISNLGSNNTFVAEDSANDLTPFVIDASGNLGIGTTTPGSLFSLANGGSAQFTGTTTFQGIVSTSTAQLALNGGFVSVGATTSPKGLFSVQGSSSDLTTTALISNLGAGLSFAVEDSANDTTPFVIAADGNVGIGTTGPGAVLHIGTATSGNQKLMQIGEPGFVGTYGLVLRGDSNDGIFKLYGLTNSVETTNPIMSWNRNSGNVGIGTTSPAAVLGVKGTTGTGLIIDMSSGESALRFAASGVNKWNVNTATAGNLVFGDTADRVIFQSGGNVGIGTTSPGTILGVAGAGVFTGELTAVIASNQTENGAICITSSNVFSRETDGVCDSSALRFKEDISKLSYGLNEILKLQPKFYRFKKEFKEDFTLMRAGFIAEEVVSVIPESAEYERYDNGKGIGLIENYDSRAITAVIVKALQDFYSEFQKLIARISGLEKRLDKQEFKIKELEIKLNKLENN